MDARADVSTATRRDRISSLGLAPVFTLASDLIIGSAPPERAGAAAALSETGSELGGALGIAVLGSIGVVVYRSAMADAIDVPSARETLASALQTAKDLPWPASAALVDAAREAFASSLRLVCGLAAIIALGLSFVAVLFLDRERANSGACRDCEPVRTALSAQGEPP